MNSKFDKVLVPPGHYNSPGMRRLRAHPTYASIVKQTLAEQERAMSEVAAVTECEIPPPDPGRLPTASRLNKRLTFTPRRG